MLVANAWFRNSRGCQFQLLLALGSDTPPDAVLARPNQRVVTEST